MTKKSNIENLINKEVGTMIYIPRKDCNSSFICTASANGKLSKVKGFENLYRVKSLDCDFLFFNKEIQEIKDRLIMIRIDK